MVIDGEGLGHVTLSSAANDDACKWRIIKRPDGTHILTTVKYPYAALDFVNVCEGDDCGMQVALTVNPEGSQIGTKIKLVQHFTDDAKKTKNNLQGMELVKGSKLLSLALMTVQAELALGNKNYRTNVIVFMDGFPLSFRKTKLASRQVRKKARLVYVVLTKFAPLKDIKTWVTRRWQENLVQVTSAEEFGSAETGTHIVANICPRKFPKLRVARKRGF